MDMPSTNTNFLFKNVSASSLGLLRILYGLFMIEEFAKFYYYFVDSLSKSTFHSTYDGFHWVGILPETGLHLFFGLMLISTLFFTIGLHYRLNAGLTFLGFSYIFLADQGHYNNHFYLYCIFHFFFLVTNANRWAAVDSPQEKQIPYWQLFLFKVQIFIVYFYGAIAKFHADWFEGYPLRYWLHVTSNKFGEPIASFLKTADASYIMAYSGFVFDLSIGFLLFSPRFRRLALIPIFIFHISNHFLWNIGTFPFVMIAACFIFLEPQIPQKILVHFQKYKKTTQASFLLGLALIIWGLFMYNYTMMLIGFFCFAYYLLPHFKLKGFLRWFLPSWGISAPSIETNYDYNKKNIVLIFLSSWFLIQSLFPLRHWVIKGNPSWTGEGHLFAWRMMLVATTDAVSMKLIVPETGEELPIAFEQYMNFRQFRKMGRTPRIYHKFAHFIRDEAKAAGLENPIIKMEIWKSVNERKPRLLNDTSINYAELPYLEFSPCDWYNDWDENNDSLVFREEKFKHWEELLKQYEE